MRECDGWMDLNRSRAACSTYRYDLDVPDCPVIGADGIKMECKHGSNEIVITELGFLIVQD